MTKRVNKNNETPKITEFLCFALYSTHNAMHRINKALLEGLDLTYLQFLVLVVLWEKDNQLVNDIGKRLYLESNTLTPVLKRLESMGHVKRQRDSKDERKVCISLTSSGKKLKQSTTCFPEAIQQASGMNPESMASLIKQITDLREQLMSNQLG